MQLQLAASDLWKRTILCAAVKVLIEKTRRQNENSHQLSSQVLILLSSKRSSTEPGMRRNKKAGDEDDCTLRAAVEGTMERKCDEFSEPIKL